MNLENQVTSLEISKRLKELGVKQESLFYWEYPSLQAGYEFIPTVHFGFREHDEESTYDSVSAFTVAELGEMLKPNQHLRYYNNKLMSGQYWIACDISKDNEYEFANTEADARGKCLIYLIENGLIKV